MVEIGSLQIGASINTEDLESGLRRMVQGFDNISARTGGVNADFERMSQTGTKLNKLFIGMAIVGAGAMTALAKGAPAVASSMAKIKVKAGELGRSLGEALAPAFETASDAFADFVGWIEDNEDKIGYFTNTILEGLIDALDGIRIGWNWITSNIESFSAKIGLDWDIGAVGNIILKHAGPEIFAAIVGGRVAGVPGAVAAAVTVGVGRRISDPSLITGEIQAADNILSLFSIFTVSNIRRIAGLILKDRS